MEGSSTLQDLLLGLPTRGGDTLLHQRPSRFRGHADQFEPPRWTGDTIQWKFVTWQEGRDREVQTTYRGGMDKQCKLCRLGEGICAIGFRKSHEWSDPQCRLHGSTAKGNGPRSRPVQGDPQQEAPPRTGGDAAIFRPPSPRPLAEMTQFETRRGRILLFEPERLDAWIGRGIEKDYDTGRYLDLSTGKPLSKKDATSFEAYHARRLRRSRLGDKVDRYIRLVDKYVPQVSEEARVYIARFPHKVGEVLGQVRKIRKKIRKNRRKQQHQAVLQPTSSSTTTPGGAAAQAVPGEEPAGELETKEHRDILGHDDGEQLDGDTPPDWGEEVQRKRPSNQPPVLTHGRGEKQAAHRIVEKALEC